MISCTLKKQPIVARLRIKYEYRSIANGASELDWVRSILEEQGIVVTYPLKLWANNLGGMYLMRNRSHHTLTKHVVVHYHFVWEKVFNKTLEVLHIPTNEQVIDLLTKSLGLHETIISNANLFVQYQ